ncbi:MAG TPA: OB-fold nucleic acid binding domain-containing protein [Terriglobales bacterium]|nr:OB-fold nucleic acid binding domain-containing protein [Terriglobales bacterium]
MPAFSLVRADCMPIAEAKNHVGETRCVSGMVFRVERGERGVHFLDFCQDYHTCPFTVVVFPSDLKNVGDIRQLKGKTVEIHGPVKEYDGRAEIILAESRQLGGEAKRIPPMPKSYDVENRGHYSVGTFRAAKAKKTYPKREPAKLPVELPGEEPE